MLWETESFFGAESPLMRIRISEDRRYEERPQQARMALAVAKAFRDADKLCVEAPTGVGKSFAYLVPAIHFARDMKRPVLVSTETINLQEQLIQKDIPLLRQVMDIDFKAALAKGRSNYLCLRRLWMLSGEHGEEYLPDDSMVSGLENLRRWTESAEEACLSALPFNVDRQLWDMVCCEVGNCRGPRCRNYKKCFYWKARKSWDKADIVVANHALFFTDLKIKKEEGLESSFLPNYAGLVFDEAHQAEDSAAQHLGLQVSSIGIKLFLRRLYDSRSGKGLLMKSGRTLLDLRRSVGRADDAADQFFGAILRRIDESGDSILRMRVPDIVPDTLSEHLGELARRLEEYLEVQEDEDYRMELEMQRDRCGFYREAVRTFMSMALPEHVYWAEKRGEMRPVTRLYAAPLNVSELLRRLIFSDDYPVIFTGATLSVSNRLDYFRERSGFQGGELILDSPYDYASNMQVFIPGDMPLPNEEDYLHHACEQIEHYIRKTHGKAFVLFTSYSMMKMATDAMRPVLDSMNIDLYVQGGELDRSRMLREFRRNVDSVIFGTSSFWTGVDVPGLALSNVIITRLPFAVPSHPLVQARTEILEKNGQSAFMNYQLPEAVLRFRQGVGRLIRNKTDEGILVVLDRRIISKRYGRAFLDSIPECPVNIC